MPPHWFDRPSPDVARDLIGAILVLRGTGGRIVETEAYTAEDPASHSFRGPGLRNASMFGPAGRAYVYRSYGIHWCLNVVCRQGEAVLLRALEPTVGLEAMAKRRGMDDPRMLCSGPGRLGQALGVGPADDGIPLVFEAGVAGQVIAGPRIGITRAVDIPWRFGEAGSPWLSRPFRNFAPAGGLSQANPRRTR